MVLATLKRAPSELSSFSRKVFKIDDHLGIAASGLASDGRGLCRYMRNECINHRWAHPPALALRIILYTLPTSVSCHVLYWIGSSSVYARSLVEVDHNWIRSIIYMGLSVKGSRWCPFIWCISICGNMCPFWWDTQSRDLGNSHKFWVVNFT